MSQAHASLNGNSRLNPHWTSPRYHGLVKLRRAIEGVVARHIAPLRQSGSSVVAIDLGCGTMPYRTLFAPHVDAYLGADLERNEVADLALDPATGRVDVEPHTASVIVSTQVLEHVECPRAYLDEAHRIAAPNALLVLSTHGMYRYHPDPQDYWRWTSAGLTRLLAEERWEVIEMVGVLGMAAAGAGFIQAALVHKSPRPLKRFFEIVGQRCVGVLDKLSSDEDRLQNAVVYLAVARRVEGALIA